MEEIDSDQDEPTGLEGAAFQSRLPYDKMTAQEGAGEFLPRTEVRRRFREIGAFEFSPAGFVFEWTLFRW